MDKNEIDLLLSTLMQTERGMNIPHADVCSELKFLRRALVLIASTMVSNNQNCKLSEVIPEVNRFVAEGKIGDWTRNPINPVDNNVCDTVLVNGGNIRINS